MGFFDQPIRDYRETCSKLYNRIKEIRGEIRELESQLPGRAGKRGKGEQSFKFTAKNRASYANVLDRLDMLQRRLNILMGIYQDMMAAKRVCENYYAKGVYLDQRYSLRGPRPYKVRQVPYYEIEDVLCHIIDFSHDRPLTGEVARSIGDIDRKAKDGGDITLWREVVLPADGAENGMLKAELSESSEEGHYESPQGYGDEANN